jgi:hypothetical protein
MLRPSFAILAPPDEPTTATALCALIAESAKNLTATVVDTLPEAIGSPADVLILVLPDYPVADLEDAFVQRLEGRKVIGIGYAAAELFGRLGLEIRGGACAHYGAMSMPFKLETNVLLGTTTSGSPLHAVQSLPQGVQPDNFAMHIPSPSQLLAVVDVIARLASDMNYAPIVRQGSYIMMGTVAPAVAWTPEFRDLFRAIAIALHERPAEPFARAQWDCARPASYTFMLATGSSTTAPSDKVFYLRFAKPTTFTATLRHRGSESVMLLFMGEKHREHWTREDAYAGEDLEISIDITEGDLREIGDWHWMLKVTNFDREHTVECSLQIAYEE